MKKKWLIFSSSLFLTLYFMMNINFKNSFMFYNFNEIQSLNSLNKKFLKNILLLYEHPFSSMSILCMIFLLLSLIIIIKICISNTSKPLRKIN